MKLQKFEADNMPQALEKVKAALGVDAIIMETRSLRKPGKLGVGLRDCVQVWAAQSLEDAHLAPAGLGAAAGVVGYAPSTGGVPAAPGGERLDTGLLTALHARLGDLESKLDLLTAAAAYGNGAWTRNDLPGGAAESERAAALAGLARRLPVSGEIALESARVVALIGPTGVGKTLTIAKLAGRFALAGARVGVVCADGYRVGAMGEMRAYCGLLGVPMTAARDGHELAAALDAHRECDLVLVDTPGISPRNDEHLRELRELLVAVGPDEIHAVLAAVSSHQACSEAAARLGSIGATHLVFTKLDEAPEPAEALSAAMGAGQPISYIAHGQAVPQDLHPASEELVGAVLCPESAATVR